MMSDQVVEAGMGMPETHISGIEVWDKKFKGNAIPGSTRPPVAEITKHFEGKTRNLAGLDLGSGSGRSTKILEESLGAKLHAIDLSLEGLVNTSAESRVWGSGLELPYKEGAFDFVSVCGVMTNLVDKNPEISVGMRDKLAAEAFRVTKPGGVVVVSDFSSDHSMSDYPVNYARHKLITGEEGTIAVFDPNKNISFRNLTDEQVEELRESGDLVRFAHHYSASELVGIYRKAGFEVAEYKVELGLTPSGKPIENIVVTAVKP